MKCTMASKMKQPTNINIDSKLQFKLGSICCLYEIVTIFSYLFSASAWFLSRSVLAYSATNVGTQHPTSLSNDMELQTT